MRRGTFQAALLLLASMLGVLPGGAPARLARRAASPAESRRVGPALALGPGRAGPEGVARLRGLEMRFCLMVILKTPLC